ncbi:ef-hand calcium-binding domain-containing protein 2 [Limosa lapponica baueri]|uniref:Ef-hand calcium-binding domain-containing protein 2 n=1 Tax=Limosa lapponica baueri TaxID=1758121 RepID=A0A2I0UPR5_LIMLA|nr:ef-hand calcium-binding domain-containing protein 2 [Limosa lapponica baueri]
MATARGCCHGGEGGEQRGQMHYLQQAQAVVVVPLGLHADILCHLHPLALRNTVQALDRASKQDPDDAVAELEKKIMEAFEVFDHECNKTVDVREIGSIVRSLGCFPTEAELHELLARVEEEEPTGYIHLEKFLPVMTKVLLDRSYRPIPEDVLLHAFEALDENKCGYITKEDLVKYLTEEGEPFTQEEMEDMLSAALDPETNTVRYRDYVSMMLHDNLRELKTPGSFALPHAPRALLLTPPAITRTVSPGHIRVSFITGSRLAGTEIGTKKTLITDETLHNEYTGETSTG